MKKELLKLLETQKKQYEYDHDKHVLNVNKGSRNTKKNRIHNMITADQMTLITCKNLLKI